MQFKREKIFYSVYFIVILSYLIAQGTILRYLKEIATRDYMPGRLWIRFYIGAILCGTLLGLEHLFNYINKDGKWKVNRTKLIFLEFPIIILNILHWDPLLIEACTAFNISMPLFMSPVYHIFCYAILIAR